MRISRIIIIVLLIFLSAVSGCRKVPEPPIPDNSDDFKPCIPYPGTAETLDIVTFNVETFPINGYTSIVTLASLLNAIDADVYALQEVASESGFNQLVGLMPGYTGLFYLINNSDWNLAYIVKTAEVTVEGSATRLLFTDSQYFPLTTI